MSLSDSTKKKLQKIKLLPDPPKKLRPEILLGHNIPKPLHGVAPRVVLGQNWWNKERRASYKSSNYHCIACGVHKSKAKYHQWLEGHELYEIDYAKGRMKYLETVPLCHFCHNYIHDGRLLDLLKKRQIHHAKYVAILKHGDQVLRKAGLEKLSRDQRNELFLKQMFKGRIAAWKDWRLVIGRKTYKPKYNNLKELEEAFSSDKEE